MSRSRRRPSTAGAEWLVFGCCCMLSGIVVAFAYALLIALHG